MSFTWMSGRVLLVGLGVEGPVDRREMSLGEEVRHQLVEVVWAFQRQHV